MSKSLEQLLFNHKRQIKLLRNIHRLARSGVEQKLIAEQLIKYGQPTERKIGEGILRSIGNGQGFSLGTKPWLDSLAFEALAAGEHTGEWARGVQNAIITLSSKSASTSLLVKALWKPIAGIVALLAASAGISLYLFPMLDEIMTRGRKGQLSQLAASFGNFWADWGLLIGSLTLLFVIALFLSLSVMTGNFRKQIDNFPVYRQYRMIQTGAFLRSMGNLTLAGFGLKDALLQTKKHANRYLLHHIAKMLEKIEWGEKNLGYIMATGLLNKAEENSLFLLGQIGGTSETLLNSADIHHELLMEEIELIKSIGIDALKLIGFAIGLLMGGGVILQIMDIATRVNV
jgi:type II secretory pathway component PulF